MHNREKTQAALRAFLDLRVAPRYTAPRKITRRRTDSDNGVPRSPTPRKRK